MSIIKAVNVKLPIARKSIVSALREESAVTLKNVNVKTVKMVNARTSYMYSLRISSRYISALKMKHHILWKNKKLWKKFPAMML